MAWDSQFKPNKMDNVLEVWSSKGLQIYSQLLINNNVDTFEVISNRYNLPQSNFYKCLQLENYINFQKREGNQEQHPLITFMIKNYNVDT